MMQINAINNITQLAAQGPVETGSAAADGPSFGTAMKSALEMLDRQQIGAEGEIAKTVAGDSPDLHRTFAALQTADLGFQFALQVRNKVMDAYNEIMRMQV